MRVPWCALAAEFSVGPTELKLVGVTLTGNRGEPWLLTTRSNAGGAIAATGAEISISNSIVVGNVAQNGANAILGCAQAKVEHRRRRWPRAFRRHYRIAPGIFAGRPGRERRAHADRGACCPAGTIPRSAAPIRTVRGRDGPARRGPGRPSRHRCVRGDAAPGVTADRHREAGRAAGDGCARQLDGREGDDLLRGLDGGTTCAAGRTTTPCGATGERTSSTAAAGATTIFGGSNDDSLRGGAGPDRFVFFERFGVDVIADFDARPANGQDRIDLRHLGISAGNFEERVTITDLGGATLVAVEDAGAILCRGVDGEGGERDHLAGLPAARLGLCGSTTSRPSSQQDAAERALNKLARTFATQLEALKRYRTGGMQKAARGLRVRTRWPPSSSVLRQRLPRSDGPMIAAAASFGPA